MKKLLLITFAALMSWTSANAQSDEEYYAALAAIDNGASYYITTDVSGTKYYLTTTGSLTNAIGSAGTFTVTQATGGAYKTTAFKIFGGTNYFSNPPGTNDAALTQNNNINTNSRGDNTWEAQVLFLNSNGKYAVRCTNAAEGSSWNYVGKAYWTVNSGPVAQYSFTVNYIWNFEKVGDVTYTHVNSTKTDSNNDEWAGRLIDGVGSTKWGEGLTTGNPRWIIFKTDRAISPTQYKLTVANDTYGDQRRQWTKWKIYGANFYSEKLATKDATEWVLLDQKDCPTNTEFPVGSASRTYSHTDFSMSENNTGYYQYFKIVVEEIRTSGAYMQMGDFRFKAFNAKTVGETWQTKVTLAQTFDRGTLAADYPLYTEYSGYSTGLNGYLSSGNYSTLESHLDYVVELRRVMSDYIGGRDFSGLDGTACWGDGHYDQLVDGNNSTKWGGDFSGSVGDPEHVQWTIFRAKTPIKPYFYNLRTAWDAEGWGGRNWKDWKIYGGNFATMDAAVRGASWTLIDERSGVGRDLLPAKNSYLAPFGTSEYASLNEEYSYFKVEVSAAYTDASIQMNELTLGTEAEFTATKDAYLDELNDYTPPTAASSTLKTEYVAAVTAVENATPENILSLYNAAKAKQMEIFESLKDGSDYYHLYSGVDLGLFADVVNGEGGNLGAKAKLEADIDLSGITLMKIGSNGRYSGEFDGQNHVISHLSFSDQAGGRTGMFGYTGGATIKNIIFEEANVGGRDNISVVVGDAQNGTIQNIKVRNSVASEIPGTGSRAGFIAGQADGTTIKNCAVINSKMTGHNFAGAIVGYAIGGATVQNCYSNAVIEAGGTFAGGIAGAAATATIEKTLFTGTVKSVSDAAAGVIGKFNVANDQNYTLIIRNNMVAAATVKAPSTRTLVYLPTFPESQTTNPTYANNYILRCGAHSDEVKGVTNKDDLNGKNMERSEVTVLSFYTDLGWDMTDDWTFIANGLFPILKGMESDIDLIGSPSDLNAFATKINNGGYSFLARLTTDITANGSFTPIGTETYKYFGTFDGQGHTVTLAINNTGEDFQALFGKAQGGADFRNLIIAGSVAGKQCNAALVGEAKPNDGQDQGKAGTIYVDHVGCEAAVSGTDANAYTSAFIGNVWGTRVNLEVYNSYNTGAISGTGVVSVFGNVNSNSKFTNVYNSGNISLDKMDNNGNGNYTNSYTNTTGTTRDGLTKGITAEQFASGEICYLLNGDQSSIVFYQAIETDDNPTLKSASGRVYIHGKVCPDSGTIHGDITYSNASDPLISAHNYVDGFCSYCGALQSDYMTPTDGYYMIGTLAQFKWFVAYVNAGNTSANAKLTANIDYTAYTGVDAMIGDNNNVRYAGIFDGQGHTVTVAFNTTSVQETGLFRRINGATIQNLKVAGTITASDKFAGGVVARIEGTGTIKNCESAVTINDSESGDATHGGILACANASGTSSIESCLFSGKINASSRTGCSGIVGWGTSSAAVTNCLVIGEITLASGDNDIISRGSATGSGNYYCGTYSLNNRLTATSATATQKTSGELCYLLNGSVADGTTWTQTIGTDANPILFSTSQTVHQASPSGYTNLTVVDSKTQIADGATLKQFAAEVNAGNTNVDAVLTADINLNEIAWTPIGNGTYKYTGTFDGQNHAITYFSLETSTQYSGLFGVINGATVKDFSISGTMTTTGAENGVVAWAEGSSVVSGIHSSLNIIVNDVESHNGGIVGGSQAVNGATLLVENCEYNGTLTVSGSKADVTGGILGYTYVGAVRNCLFSGTINGNVENKGYGGILGYSRIETFGGIKNCLSIGKIVSNDGNTTAAAIIGNWGGPATTEVENNYYKLQDGSTTSAAIGGANPSRCEAPNLATTESLSSGEVTYKLNKNSCYNVAWTQTLGTNNVPTLDKVEGVVNKISSVRYTTQYIGNTDVTIPEDVEAYAGVINGEWLSLREITTGVISKDDAVVLKGSEGYYSFVPTTGAEPYEGNSLLGSDGTVVGSGDGIYALAKKDKVGFYPVGTAENPVTIPAGKAYLIDTEAPSGGGLVKAFYFEEDDDPTGIESIQNSSQSSGAGGTKFKIQNEEPVYNLAGQRVDNSQFTIHNSQLKRGIYIVNGKKIAIK